MWTFFKALNVKKRLISRVRGIEQLEKCDNKRHETTREVFQRNFALITDYKENERLHIFTQPININTNLYLYL